MNDQTKALRDVIFRAMGTCVDCKRTDCETCINMNRRWIPDARKALSDTEDEAKKKLETVTNCNGLGNEAKLREAAMAMEDFLARHQPDGFLWDATEPEKGPDEMWEEFCEIDLRLEKALAAPARNCDVGTAEEQDKRFGKFCMSNNFQSCKGCVIYDSPNQSCGITWGQLPYEAPAAQEGGDHASK